MHSAFHKHTTIDPKDEISIPIFWNKNSEWNGYNKVRQKLLMMPKYTRDNRLEFLKHSAPHSSDTHRKYNFIFQPVFISLVFRIFHGIEMLLCRLAPPNTDWVCYALLRRRITNADSELKMLQGKIISLLRLSCMTINTVTLNWWNIRGRLCWYDFNNYWV